MMIHTIPRQVERAHINSGPTQKIFSITFLSLNIASVQLKCFFEAELVIRGYKII